MKELKNERYKDMKKKNVKVIGCGVLVIGMLFASMPTMAQFTEPERPQATFQSTSTMTPTGSQYSSNPSLNADGTASSPTATTPGPRKAKMGGTGLPSVTEEMGTGQGNTPVGDAVLPFTLLSMVAAGVVYLRRRKQQA